MKHAFAIFVAVVLAIWSLMHVYVFWRLASLPWVADHVSNRALALIAVALWLSYPIARVFPARISPSKSVRFRLFYRSTGEF
jgi:hypothetical protein